MMTVDGDADMVLRVADRSGCGPNDDVFLATSFELAGGIPHAFFFAYAFH